MNIILKTLIIYKDGSFQQAMFDDTGEGNQPKNGLWLMISLVHGLNEDFIRVPLEGKSVGTRDGSLKESPMGVEMGTPHHPIERYQHLFMGQTFVTLCNNMYITTWFSQYGLNFPCTWEFELFCVVKPTLNRDEPPKVAIQCNIFIDGPKGTSSNLAWTLPHCPHFRPRLSRKKPSNYFQRPAAKGFIKPGLQDLPLRYTWSIWEQRLGCLGGSPPPKNPTAKGPPSIKIEPYLIATPWCIASTRLPPITSCRPSHGAVEDHAVQWQVICLLWCYSQGPGMRLEVKRWAHRKCIFSR